MSRLREISLDKKIAFMGPSIKQAKQAPNGQAKLVVWILGGQSRLPPPLYYLVLRSELKKRD